MSDQKLCICCRTPRVETVCELCGEPVCRQCKRTLPEDSFAFDDQLPESLKHSLYCDRCYGSEVEPALERYAELLEKAKEVLFIPRTFRGQLFVLKKSQTEVSVAESADRDEMILNMAFRAARDDFNALIQGEVICKKVRNHGYQKSVWSGHAFPASLDLTKLNRNDYLEEVWRRGH